MNKTCLDCQTQFVIFADELKFIDRMSPVFAGKKYSIPAPDICPNCRLRIRTAHRNEQFLHHNKSAISGEPVIALYSPDTPWGKDLKIYTHDQWWNDKWDALDYGQDYDFNRPFFEQFHELIRKIPLVNLIQVDNENSPFTTGTGYCKNCYLISCSENCEDSYYGKLIQSSRDVMDSSYAYDSELLYQCFYVKNCYNCKYVSYSQNATDCWFSENLKGCRSCFLCTNLSNKEYYFMNQPLSKEQYEAKIKEFIGTEEKVKKALQILADLRKKRIYKYANVISCENSTGDFLTNCQNCFESYDVNDSQDCRYVTVGVNVKDLMDCSNMYLKPELNYQVLGTIGTYNIIYSLYIFSSQDIMYSQFCYNSKNLFGCCGLRNKQYCIFNKQYTRENYEKLVPMIIEHMQKNGDAQDAKGVQTTAWGKYFPISLSPFGYNESVAQEYLPLTKEQAIAKGYHWKDPDKKEYKPQSYTVPESISAIPDEILNQILACERVQAETLNEAADGKKCGRNYKIIPQELKRLQAMNLPIPRFCPDCRHIERMKLRNPRKLWARSCQKCQTSVQTTFAANSSETVYCESCYLKEVY